MNKELIQAGLDVLDTFSEVLKLVELAQLEETTPYGLIGGALVTRGIDLDDSRIASHLSPTGQLLQQVIGDRAEVTVDDEATFPRVKLYNRSGQMWLTIPMGLAEIERAWWRGYLPELLPDEVAVDGGVKRDPYWDFPHPVADSDRW